MKDTSEGDHTSELRGAIAQSVLKRILGSTIVARVRATPVLRNVLFEALAVALLLGILSRLLVGLPISVCFFATLALFAEAVLQVHFATAYTLYREWTTFRRKSYLVIGVIAVGHLLVAQALQIASPAEVYAEIVRLDGFREMYLHNTASDSVTLAMCLDVLLLMVSVPAVFEKSRKAWRWLFVIASVSILLILKPINWHAVDECFASRGLIPCTVEYLRHLLFGQ